MVSEFEFIDHIKSKYALHRIGDDCAVLPKDAETDLLVTADMLVENIDFRLDWTTPEFLGHKALAVSLSDIAAMGGTPEWAMLTIGIPQGLWHTDFIDRFYTGWFSLAAEFDVELDKLKMTGDVNLERHRSRVLRRMTCATGSIYISNRMTLRLWIGRLLALGVVLSAIFFMWRVYAGTGLFISLGMDYGLYLAQATVMGGDDPAQIYDKSTTNVVYRHLLDIYGHDPSYDSATPGKLGFARALPADICMVDAALYLALSPGKSTPMGSSECAPCLVDWLAGGTEEIILWMSQPFGFIRLADSYTTGSSIMPQKRNADAAELVRGKSGDIVGSLMQILMVVKGLPMTYNKDLQDDKAATFKAFDTLSLCVEAMGGMLATMTVNPARMAAVAEAGYATATELADWLVQQLGLPFREAHHVTGRIVKMAEGKGCRLDELQLAEMQTVEPRITSSVYDVLKVESALRRRGLIRYPRAPDRIIASSISESPSGSAAVSA